MQIHFPENDLWKQFMVQKLSSDFLQLKIVIIIHLYKQWIETKKKRKKKWKSIREKFKNLSHPTHYNLNHGILFSLAIYKKRDVAAPSSDVFMKKKKMKEKENPLMNV